MPLSSCTREGVSSHEVIWFCGRYGAGRFADLKRDLELYGRTVSLSAASKTPSSSQLVENE